MCELFDQLQCHIAGSGQGVAACAVGVLRGAGHCYDLIKYAPSGAGQALRIDFANGRM